MPILLSCCAGCIVRTSAKELAQNKATRFVRAVQPEVGSVIERVKFVGFVEPQLLLSLHFLVPGRLSSCVVREGEAVRQGEEVCRLDMAAINLEVSRSQNAVSAAKRVMETNLPEKQKALFEAGVIGQAEFEQVRVQSESAKAQFEDASSLHNMALKKRKEHVLEAPWAGTVTRLLAKPGQPVVPEMPMAVLSDERTVQIGVEIHASYFSKLRVGAKAKLTSFSARAMDNPIALTVVEKATVITPESQSFRVILRPDGVESNGLLTPGVLVTGEMVLEEKERVLKIPQSSLVSWEQSGKASVYVVEENQLRLRGIQTGSMDSGIVEVREGLRSEDLLASELAPDFVPGLMVEVVR